jgi:glycosyltransferase involved in cell wall biosynthesis
MIFVLIPLYNGIEYLPEAIHSVIGQTYTHWKILVGINGHGDNSHHVANQVRAISNDERIEIIIQPPEINNKSKSLNHLVRLVNTEWVALLDADDAWLPRKLEAQVAAASENPECEVIGTQCEYFGTLSGSPRIPLGSIPRKATLEVNPIINSSVLLKTKYARWNELLFKEGYEDYELWLTLDFQGVRMFNVPEILVRHRIYPTSAFNTNTGDTTALKQSFKGLYDNTTCVVTAYYPLSKSKHSTAAYKTWYTNFFRAVTAPVICFCAPEMEAEFRNLAGPNVRIVIREFGSFPMMSTVQMEKWRTWHLIDPERHIHSPELYAVWATKPDFVLEAMRLYEVPNYVWCDIGCFREPGRPGSFEYTPKYVRPGKMTCLGIGNTIGGGVLAGDRNAWRIFADQYSTEVAANLHGKDQDIFKRFLTDETATIIYPHDRFGDPWFFLTYVFSTLP